MKPSCAFDTPASAPPFGKRACCLSLVRMLHAPSGVICRQSLNLHLDVGRKSNLLEDDCSLLQSPSRGCGCHRVCASVKHQGHPEGRHIRHTPLHPALVVCIFGRTPYTDNLGHSPVSPRSGTPTHLVPSYVQPPIGLHARFHHQPSLQLALLQLLGHLPNDRVRILIHHVKFKQDSR